MFDTHCHLNFTRFKNNVTDVVARAKEAEVTGIIVPGTDQETSEESVRIAEQYEEVYSAVGIHPHHATSFNLKREMQNIEELLKHKKVVAVGEVGLDKHQYTKTKYQAYTINATFIETQKQMLVEQIQLALIYDKSLILHNREAKTDLLPLLVENWDEKLRGRTVFHCCESDSELLEFAQKYGIFIGVDGDVTYDSAKASFIQHVPLSMLVVETDAPYLLPEPLRSQKLYPNEPKNIPLIIEKIARLKNERDETIGQTTLQNSKKLFHL